MGGNACNHSIKIQIHGLFHYLRADKYRLGRSFSAPSLPNQSMPLLLHRIPMHGHHPGNEIKCTWAPDCLSAMAR